MSVTGIGAAAPEMSMAGSAAMAAATVPLRVLDMSMDVFEDAANQLIEALSAIITGLGGNIDIYA